MQIYNQVTLQAHVMHATAIWLNDWLANLVAPSH